jgi:hypothetical protein
LPISRLTGSSGKAISRVVSADPTVSSERKPLPEM